MNKSLLVVMCLLAFAAGGAAHLVLQRASAPAVVKSEFVETKTEPPAPAAPAAEAPPQPTAAAPEVEARADEVRAAEESKPSEPPAEPAAPAAAPNAGRASSSKTARASTRPRSAQAVAPPPPAPADSVETSGDNRGLTETTVSGAKKTGKLVGKGLKKLGGVFHD